ncbi:ergothioneine biosynthesis protein EgtB [Pseudomonas sp. 10B1]|uniref:ergothioneine biosynthesis protein EgtB n=1 Tax=unclassified Pseudomonas TaxID=196821 RepID=UPI002B239A16|nr:MULTISPECIES: ergothioneine biosynthesis protein EgtB [unclassified Pseudomonas]MEA9977265.1 ergothioneine biosynthesis protein EgtB [Pseudomonas sp. RTS4]MEA9995662.1 ergothioneine biosynthesis protein EgtB [Pseudomonas sp. AA4]MEB0088011.1 ergothioneine biosynthesis protein EgtB [Pseudomonas sp. RTI1]MEB0127005.1 ergothioneine biosynthesis protein EgtB [Pseudomonas sp. CCC1.2]MEB0154447.1 ergothioneine biosynthesis protein EgtB [Pseudomonas sp. CCC4.3]
MTSTSSELRDAPDSNALLKRYLTTRCRTESLIEPLSAEDMVVQSMPDASPAKWHIAHTSWFFETFLLRENMADYRPFDPTFAYLFNSYYEAIGPRQPRPHRGLMTRPTVDQIVDYRKYVDAHMCILLQSPLNKSMSDLIELGLSHEEQHQELLLMDILHLFSVSSLKPAYDPRWAKDVSGRRGQFKPLKGGLTEIGHKGKGFAFDNEGPRHTTFLQSFEISDRLVTNGEWLAFMADGGYSKVGLWLSDGWATVQSEGWNSPVYWQHDEQGWKHMTLRGLEAIDPAAPVISISYYEAAAFAHWADARLPTEAEWEAAAEAGLLEQVDDVAWQWTQSAYSAYPGFRPADSAVGEYNGKFMVNVMVLRGGASITTPGHCRTTYRNFFGPDKRWMFSGLRLARDKRQPGVVNSHDSEFARDVVTGLSAPVKNLSPKYFYDAAGSELFEAICQTAEYYPTRAETGLLANVAQQIAALIPAGAALVEFGSGASEKTRLLLDSAPQIAVYVPIDISANALKKAAALLKKNYPALNVAPQIDDFSRAMQLPAEVVGHTCVGFFPGSTIGNFTHPQAVTFLRSAHALLGKGAHFIVGVDLVKNADILVAAYDDAEGVTGRFNKNLLTRINRELDGNFNVDAFEHLALWNEVDERMEMHLVSQNEQVVKVAGHTFHFAAGERLHTENSHKFTVESFTALAASAGWSVDDFWVSDEPQVALFSLKA